MAKISIPVKKCRQCGAELGVSLPEGSEYGSPIRVCPTCHTQYVDRAYREIAVDGLTESDRNPKASFRDAFIMLAVALGLAVLLFVGYVYGRRLYLGILVIDVLLWLGVGYSVSDTIKKKTGKKEEELARLRAESEARLRDPEYARTLQKLGYSVPEEYLQAD